MSHHAALWDSSIRLHVLVINVALSPRNVDVRFCIPSAPVVEKVCEYMSFKAHYEGAGSKEDISINEFTERIPPEIALELYVL